MNKKKSPTRQNGETLASTAKPGGSPKGRERQNPKIIELEKQVAELTSGWQRTQADFLNFKKQIADDRVKLINDANADLILEILPVLDNFQLAAKHTPRDLADNVWAQGINQIEKQLELILNNSGLIKIESVGQPFDAELHEAIEEVESKEKSGTIVEEVLAGYTLDDKLIRAAKVKVSK